MLSHSLTLFGYELSFKAKANREQLQRACAMLEKRYSALAQTGGHLSKEKLLAYLSLALAADLLDLENTQTEWVERLGELLVKIEETTK